MPAVPSPRKSTEPLSRELEFKELVALAKQFLSNPANRAVEEEFAAGCLSQITKFIKVYVYFKFIPEIVVDDAVSLAQLNWVRGIRDLRSPEDLKQWLVKVSRNAAVTEFLRIIIGRAGQERETVPLETQDMEGKPVETLDLQPTREAAQRYGAASSKSLGDFREQVERQKILGQLLRIHIEQAKTKRDRDSALWIKTTLDEDLPVEEIARTRGTTKDDVCHLLSHDTKALRRIYQELLSPADG